MTSLGPVTQPYGCTGFSAEPKVGACDHFHLGLDIGAVFQKLASPVSGIVTQAGTDPASNGGYGNFVVVTAGNGLQWLFGHLSQISVKPGQAVASGDQLGVTGDSGNSSGPHLHVGVFNPGANVFGTSGSLNPAPLLAAAYGNQNPGVVNKDNTITLPLIGTIQTPLSILGNMQQQGQTQVQGQVQSNLLLDAVSKVPGLSGVGDWFSHLGMNLWRAFLYLVGLVAIVVGLIIYVFSDRENRQELEGMVA